MDDTRRAATRAGLGGSKSRVGSVTSTHGAPGRRASRTTSLLSLVPTANLSASSHAAAKHLSNLDRSARGAARSFRQ